MRTRMPVLLVALVCAGVPARAQTPEEVVQQVDAGLGEGVDVVEHQDHVERAEVGGHVDG